MESRSTFLSLDSVIMTKADLAADNFDLKSHLENIEINLINEALYKAQGVVSTAAKILGIRRTTLIEKMKKYQIVKKSVGEV